MKSISIQEVLNVKGGKIIDVREPFEFENGSLPGAKNVPLMGLIMNVESFLNKEDKYYIVCQSGARSMQACMVLEEKGYNVVQVEGGVAQYK